MSSSQESHDGSNASLLKCLALHAEERPEARAIAYYGNDLTYADLYYQVGRLAGALLSLSVQPGDRVAIQMQNSPQYIVAYYAVLAVRGVVVPLNPMYRSDEVAAILGDAGAKVAFVAEEF